MKINELAEFAQRLNEMCDEGGVPPKGKARQAIVAKLFDVSQKGARKWLEGEGFPSQQKGIQICRHWNVHYDWLMTGRGQKYVTTARPPRKLEIAFRLMQELPEYKLDEAIKILAVLAEPGAKARER